MGRPPLKKGAIERSSLELFVERGVDGTSIRDIAQRAGVTEGALYRHHRSKNDLVRALFFASYEGFGTMISSVATPGAPLHEVIPKLVQSFYDIYDKDPYIFNFVMVVRHKLLDEVRVDDRNPVELLFRLIQDAIQRGEIPKQNASITTEMILGVVLQVAVGVQHGRLEGPLTSHAAATASACLLMARHPVT